MLNIKDLHASVENKAILRGLNLTGKRRRSARDHGPERIRQKHAVASAGRTRNLTQ